MDESKSVEIENFPDSERKAVYRAIYERRDIRHFRTDPIPDDVLARIIQAAHHGPSVGFMQPWDFILIKNPQIREQAKALFERERQAASCFYDEPRRSQYLSLKLEGIMEAPVSVCVTCDYTRADEVLERLGLADIADGLVGELAHGQRQWVEIGMVIAGEPKIVLLDEPSAGMSAEETNRTAELIREVNRTATIVVVEHDMQFIRQIASRVTVFHQGKILVEESVEKVMSDPVVRDVYLGKQA